MRALDLVVRAFGPLTQPFNFRLHLVAEALLLLALRFEICLLLFEESAEGAFNAKEAVGEDAVELDDLAGSGFKEVAVVADGDGGERRGAEEFFKPFNAGEVEVVGGLVEQHDFRLDDHGFRNGETLAPAAGERSCFSIEVSEAGAACQFAQAAFAFSFIDVGSGEGVLKHLANGESGGEPRILGNVGGAGPFAHGEFAGVGFHLAGEEGKQRGLAGAVGADETNAVSIFDGERDIEKKWLCAELLGYGLGIENWGHLSQEYRVGLGNRAVRDQGTGTLIAH